MTRPVRPSLYPRGRWWWYGLSTAAGYLRESGREFGLSIDVPEEEAVARILAHYGLGPTQPEPGAETLGWFREFLRQRGDKNVNERTWKLYLSDFDLFISFLGSGFLLRDVARIPHVAQFQDWLARTRERNPVTVNLTCRSVQAVFRRAFDLGYVSVNPFTRFPRVREDGTEAAHMEEDELERFLRAVRAWTPHVYAHYPPNHAEAMKRLVMIYLYLGRRRSEILGIHRADIDLERMQVFLYIKKKRRRFRAPVDIPEEIVGDFRWFLDTFRTDYPFRLFRPNSITRWVKKRLIDAGLSPDLHLHSIRHTCLSLAANQPDANLRALQQLTGHSTLAQVEQYVHGKSLGKVRFGKNYNTQEGSKE